MFHVEHFDAGQASVLRYGPRTVHFFIWLAGRRVLRCSLKLRDAEELYGFTELPRQISGCSREILYSFGAQQTDDRIA